MAATLEGFRAYIHSPEEDEVLRLCLEAARARARTAGVPDYEDNAEYDLFLYTLGAIFHDCRGGEFPAEAQGVINSFVLSLRHGKAGEAAP